MRIRASPPGRGCATKSRPVGECAAKRCDLRLVTADREFRALHFQREARAPGAFERAEGFFWYDGPDKIRCLLLPQAPLPRPVIFAPDQ